MNMTRLHHIFAAEAPRLRRFLERWSPSRAEDLTQESFARLCASDVANIESPRAFLFQTARRLAMNEARHDRIVPMELVADPDAAGAVSAEPSPERQVEIAADAAHLHRVLDELPSHKREALLLFKLDGFSHKEIGERLGVSPRTVERYISDAFSHCHLAFKARAGEE